MRTFLASLFAVCFLALGAVSLLAYAGLPRTEVMIQTVQKDVSLAAPQKDDGVLAGSQGVLGMKKSVDMGVLGLAIRAMDGIQRLGTGVRGRLAVTASYVRDVSQKFFGTAVNYLETSYIKGKNYFAGTPNGTGLRDVGLSSSILHQNDVEYASYTGSPTGQDQRSLSGTNSLLSRPFSSSGVSVGTLSSSFKSGLKVATTAGCISAFFMLAVAFMKKRNFTPGSPLTPAVT